MKGAETGPVPMVQCVECGRYCADRLGHYCPPRELDDCGEVERWDRWDREDMT